MFRHPIKKKLLQALEPKIQQAIEEHDEEVKEATETYLRTLESLSAAHQNKIGQIEENIINRFL